MQNQRVFAIQPILINGKEITIRPVRRDDISLQKVFLQRLSDESRRFGFFGGTQPLSDEEVLNLCDLDFHNAMALVAITVDKGNTLEIGAARYVPDNNGSHQLALIIADEFRRTTLGRTLVEYLIAYAKKHRVQALYSVDQDDNIEMRQLAEQLGMSVRLDPNDAHQVIYSLNVDVHPDTVVL